MGLHGALCSIPFNLIYKMTISEKKIVLTFVSTAGIEGVCKDRICASGCCIHHSLVFDMQHNHNLRR